MIFGDPSPRTSRHDHSVVATAFFLFQPKQKEHGADADGDHNDLQ